jgi:hypothetical protein
LSNIYSAGYINANGNISSNGTMFGLTANLSGNVNANLANIASHIIGNGNLYISNGTMFGNLANVASHIISTGGNIYANTGNIYSLAGAIIANTHIIANANIYANTGNVYSVNHSLTGNLYANAGIIYSNLANVSSHIISVGGNIYANSGFVIANSLTASGNASVTGNITGSTLVGSLFSGNGSALSSIQASNIVGTVGTATQIVGATQGNITALPNIAGFGSSISINTSAGNITSVNFSGNHYGNGYYLSSVNGANVSGTVPTATNATTAGAANSVAWANVTGRPTVVSYWTNDASYASTGFVTSQGYLTGITSSQVTTALGFTPYNSSNPSGYITGVSAGTGISVSGTTISVNSSGTPQVGSLGVGTAASGTTGEIRATNNITAYYSDDRLKTRLGSIENALDKIDSLSGFYYEENDLAVSLGYTRKRQVGLSAQQVQNVLPEVVTGAPIDPDTYLTVWYDKVVPLLVEGIKELRQEIKEIKQQLKG